MLVLVLDLGVVVAAAYRPQAMWLTPHILNTDRGRCTDA